MTVSDGGRVGLPLLGQFTLAGLSEADAEKAITQAFEQRFGVQNLPVSVLSILGLVAILLWAYKAATVAVNLRYPARRTPASSA